MSLQIRIVHCSCGKENVGEVTQPTRTDKSTITWAMLVVALRKV